MIQNIHIVFKAEQVEELGGLRNKCNSMKRDLLFYQYDGEVIWGITAEITYKFIQKIKHYRKSDD